MRTTPIIQIIRKYGLTSKRLNPKNRIKYEEAVALIKQYESSDLKIKDVIDNTRANSHNNCHCGIPGCGQHIRYEYILVSKDGSSDKEIVAGSTCVWPTLGMSELTKKEFMKLDTAVREHYALLDWREANKEVVDKLKSLKDHDITYYRAFWQEIEVSPLTKEDTDFIRSVDVDKEIEKAEYSRKMREVSKEEYDKVMSYIPELREFYKKDDFVMSLCNAAEGPHKISGNQYRWMKVMINRMWFTKNVKGTPNDLTSDCEDIMKSVLDMMDFNKSDLRSVNMVNDYVYSTGDITLKWAWVAYKCKNAIVS